MVISRFAAITYVITIFLFFCTGCGLTSRSISTINKTIPMTKLSPQNNGSPIQTLAISPDQKYLVQGQHITAKEGDNFSGNILEIYNIEKKNPSLVLKQRTGANIAAKFSDDSKYVIACGNTGVAKISLTDERTQVVNMEEPKFLSSDGTLVACSSGNGWLIKSTSQNSETALNVSLPENVERFLAFSSAKNTFAVTLKDESTSDVGTQIAIWTINEENRPEIQIKWNVPCYVTAEKSRFSPHGKYFASPSRQGYIGIWETSSGKLLKELGEHDGVIRTLEFSPDNTMLAVGIQEADGKYGKLTVWDIHDKKIIREFYDKQTKGITAVCFAQDNETLFVGNTSGEVRRQNIKNKDGLFSLWGE